MSSRYQIDSYLPEISFLDGKQERSTRVCTERCAVLDVGNATRILASRGKALTVGDSFYAATSMTESEQRQFQAALAKHRRFFIRVGQAPLLVLADWYSAVGLCLVILPSSSPAAIRAALQATGRTDIVDLLGENLEKALIRERRKAYTHLSELLHYVDALFEPCIPASRLFQTVAAFAGCHTAQYRLTATEDEIGHLGSHAVSFLLCAFLSIRSTCGTVEACEAHGVPVRATLQYTTPLQDTDGKPLPFLQARCFDGYRFEHHGNLYSLTLPEKALRCARMECAPRLTLCIEILPCAG